MDERGKAIVKVGEELLTPRDDESVGDVSAPSSESDLVSYGLDVACLDVDFDLVHMEPLAVALPRVVGYNSSDKGVDGSECGNCTHLDWVLRKRIRCWESLTVLECFWEFLFLINIKLY